MLRTTADRLERLTGSDAQLVLYAERGVTPRLADDATPITLVGLARLFDWRAALTVVKPGTRIRCHRKGFRLVAMEVKIVRSLRGDN